MINTNLGDGGGGVLGRQFGQKIFGAFGVFAADLSAPISVQ